MTRVSPLMLAPPLIFGALAVLFYFGMSRSGSDELESVFVGQPAPSVAGLKTMPGFAPLTQADLARGEVSVVNFWASWCPPCRAEHPTLLKLAQDHPVLGVNFKDTQSAAVRYLNEDGNPFTALGFDPKGRTAIDWGVTAPPETFILDPEGKVLFRFAGPLVGSDYEQRFLPALQKALAGD